LDENSINARFISAANLLLAGRAEAIKNYQATLKTVFDVSRLKAEQDALQEKMSVVSEMMQKMIHQNASTAQNQEEYNQKFSSMSERFDTAKAKYDAVTEQIDDKLLRKGQMDDFLKLLKKQDGELTEFSDSL
jgi:hypothetical protein